MAWPTKKMLVARANIENSDQLANSHLVITAVAVCTHWHTV